MFEILGVVVFLMALAAGSRGAVNRSMPLARLRQEYAAAQAATGSHRKAEHLYLLNDIADRYAYALNKSMGRLVGKQTGTPATKGEASGMVEEANRYGAGIRWCEVDADWTAASDGYERYLALWPDGPMAEEAWWRSKLGRKLNSCYDGDGSSEETQDFVHAYADFLRRFPEGKHRAEALRLLKMFQASLQ